MHRRHDHGEGPEKHVGTTRFMSASKASNFSCIWRFAAAQDAAAVVTEVTLMRLVGVALMNRPLMTTVWSLCDGMLNSEHADEPVHRSFLAGGVVGISFACGALALLGRGSVALTSVHVFGGFSRKHPVTLTISMLGVGAGAA